jgi:hypothetical protein
MHHKFATFSRPVDVCRHGNINLADANIPDIAKRIIYIFDVEPTNFNLANVVNLVLGLTTVEAAKIEAAEVEAAEVEVAQVEAAQVEDAQVEVAQVETTHLETAHHETAHLETAHLETAKPKTADFILVDLIDLNANKYIKWEKGGEKFEAPVTTVFGVPSQATFITKQKARRLVKATVKGKHCTLENNGSVQSFLQRSEEEIKLDIEKLGLKV